jgi:hypothetical protein
VPECGVCNACTEKSIRRKLCKDRLEVRQKLIASTFKKVQLPGPEKQKKAAKKRKAEHSPNSSNPKKAAKVTNNNNKNKKSPKLLMKKANGQLKQRVTSNGNKKMAIPDDLFPEFCRRIGAHGTGERVNVINQFVEDYPTISIRQVTMKLSEITTRERPPWIPEPEKKQGRAFMFYLRPRFYPLLPEDERPEGWEAAAAEDEVKWKEEQNRMASEMKQKEEKLKNMMPGKRELESADDDDATDEDEQPVPKKSKVSVY